MIKIRCEIVNDEKNGVRIDSLYKIEGLNLTFSQKWKRWDVTWEVEGWGVATECGNFISFSRNGHAQEREPLSTLNPNHYQNYCKFPIFY